MSSVSMFLHLFQRLRMNESRDGDWLAGKSVQVHSATRTDPSDIGLDLVAALTVSI